MLDRPRDATVQRVSRIVQTIAAQHEIKKEIDATASLVDCGLTSMAMVDLMLAIEAEFDITIPQRDMTPANFSAVTSLAFMLDRLQPL